MTDECQDDSRDSVSLISQSGSAESQLGRRRRSSTLLLLLLAFFFSGICEVSARTRDDF